MSTWVASMVSVTMRIAFFRIESGRLVSTKIILLDILRKLASATSKDVISKAMLELIPLHSAAISIETPGTVKTSPSRRTGTCKIENIQYTNVAEPACNKATIRAVSSAGSGTKKNSMNAGNNAARNAFCPNDARKIAVTKRQNESAVSER